MDNFPPAKVILVDPVDTDFFAGAETAIIDKQINLTGDWRGKEPAGEWQKLMGVLYEGGNGFETDACVSFSALDTLETYGDFCISQGLWPIDSIQWLRDHGYLDQNGKLNFSDRFTAKVSGTTHDGNSLPAVANAIRKFGLVPESAWPFPIDEIKANVPAAWDIYYKEVPQSVLDLGTAFLAQFETMYEWICTWASPATPAQLQARLKVAPIQIATAVCQPWNTDQVIHGCGPGGAHGTMLSNVQASQYDILDHYVPFDKHFAIDYNITYGLRHVMYPKTQAPQTPAPFHYTFTKPLAFNNPANDSAELRALQAALQSLKRADGTPYMKAAVFGPFGPQTKLALGLFQTDHNINNPGGQGNNFGPQS